MEESKHLEIITKLQQRVEKLEKHIKKENKVERPPRKLSSYHLFVQETIPVLKLEGVKHEDVMKKCSELWQKLKIEKNEKKETAKTDDV